MAPMIELSEATFECLQKYATPLVDTPDSTVAKLLAMVEGVTATTPGKEDAAGLDPWSPPDLAHTKVSAAKINGKSLPPGLCNWNAIMMATIRAAADQLPDETQIGDLLVVNHVDGRREDSGYKFHEDLGLSIQGQDSNSAWKAIAHLARETGVKADVSFVWYDHPKAFKPGANGRLAV